MNNALMLACILLVDACFIFLLIALVKCFSGIYKRDHAHYFTALDMQGGWRRIFHRSERVKAPSMVVLVWGVSKWSLGRRVFSVVWIAMGIAGSGIQVVSYIKKLVYGV